MMVDDYVVADDQTSKIQAFYPNPCEELREGHHDLMNNGEILSSEDPMFRSYVSIILMASLLGRL